MRAITASRKSSFNTQPPEGGWDPHFFGFSFNFSFNTQPPEGGWLGIFLKLLTVVVFQHTAARRRLASLSSIREYLQCFNTQPPEGGWVKMQQEWPILYCFNTQPPEGGWSWISIRRLPIWSFNTQPPEGGWSDKTAKNPIKNGFQHTAARRRLEPLGSFTYRRPRVSTHSRPKAAGSGTP